MLYVVFVAVYHLCVLTFMQNWISCKPLVLSSHEWLFVLLVRMFDDIIRRVPTDGNKIIFINVHSIPYNMPYNSLQWI